MEKNKTTNKPNTSKNDYDDDNIPEIDLPRTTEVVLPDDRPRRDGPGGE